MHCSNCDADVAAEVSADGKALNCVHCGEELKRTVAPSLSEPTQTARELLERWSREEPLDGLGSPAEETPSTEASAERPPASPPPPPMLRKPEPEAPVREDPPASEPPSARIRIDRPSTPPTPVSERVPPRRPHFTETPGPAETSESSAVTPPSEPAAQPPAEASTRAHFRFDTGHAAAGTEGVVAGLASTPHEPPAPRMPSGYRLDESHAVASADGHAAAIPAPHIPTASFEETRGPKPGRFESLAGQLLAYAGVALLTVGTAVVLFGYFGGPVSYTPTGWLIATVGQMLLFLGVVTLISGGMQQTTAEVSSRVQYLGDRMVRIEAASERMLARPHFLKDRAGAAAGAAQPASNERSADD